MRHTSMENSGLDWVNEWIQQKIKQLVIMNGPGMTGGVGGRTDYTESPGRRSQVSRALVGEGNQDAESPRRRTRVSRGHLTGSIVCHHPKENPVLLVKSVHIDFYDKQMLVLFNLWIYYKRDSDENVNKTLFSSTLLSPLLESRSTMSFQMVEPSR